MQVLIIANEQQLIKDLSFCIKVRYPEVTISTINSPSRFGVIETELTDLVILDSSLDEANSLEFISKIREFSDVPLIVLTTAQDDLERARILETGADDYITKPFSPITLLAKVKAVLRRAQGAGFDSDRSISLGELSINLNTREVSLSGKQIRLTPFEYDLLSELARNEGRVLTHDVLLEKIWGSQGNYDGSSYVKKYIYRLRYKLERDASKPQMLLTERGIGYKLIRPPE